jgi:hypothetical protein
MVAPYSEDFPGLTGIGRMMPNSGLLRRLRGQRCNPPHIRGTAAAEVPLRLRGSWPTPSLKCRFGSKPDREAQREQRAESELEPPGLAERDDQPSAGRALQYLPDRREGEGQGGERQQA